MKLILTTPNITEAYERRALLESSGIECFLNGEDRQSIAGLLPAKDGWYELYVVDDSLADEAEKLIDSQSPDSGRSWVCPKCGAVNEGQFTECWNCSPTAPEEETGQQFSPVKVIRDWLAEIRSKW